MIAESSKPDKFLIKYAPISPDTSSSGNFIELFKTVESGAQEHRLKCAVLQPDGSALSYGSASPLQQHVSGVESTDAANEFASSAASIPPAVAAVVPSAPSASLGSANASPAKPASKPVVAVSAATSTDPKDAKIQSLTSRNAELTRQVEELQKLVSKNASGSSSTEVPPEWVALLNSQTGFPPVLVVLVALFSFLVGLLF